MDNTIPIKFKVESTLTPPVFDYEAFQTRLKSITDIQQRMKVLLLETASFYNKHNRATTNGCVYHPTITSVGCAIGRCLERKSILLEDEIEVRHSSTDYKWMLECYPNEIPDWLKEMDREFLSDIQKLHDNIDCWESTGLSSFGQEAVDRIMHQWNLDLVTT